MNQKQRQDSAVLETGPGVAAEFNLHLNAAKSPVLVFTPDPVGGGGRIEADGALLWRGPADEDTVTVDLRPYAGLAVTLTLLGEAESIVRWRAPRVLDGDRVLYDLAALSPAVRRRTRPGDPAEPTPSPRQLAWQRLEFIGFIHFGVNTFTDREWGEGTETPAIFNPTKLDARQWARAAKEAGMKLLILTAKHHDGFCLWPSNFTGHSVRSSPWKNGGGDVVREFTDACREFGLEVGLYLSPWDRHSPDYGSGAAYDDYFCRQLTELLTGYGAVTEVWFDGACGEGPNGKVQQYDWARYYDTVRQLQPEALIAITGPDIRWVGNETGVARETEWSVQERDGRPVWYPAECDVSIRPGWFYHPAEDAWVKTGEALLDLYFRSVGRNAVLLLNLPPDPRGLIHPADLEALRDFRQRLDRLFRQDLSADAAAASPAADPAHPADAVLSPDENRYFSPPEGSHAAELELTWPEPIAFTVLDLAEYIESGQRIERFTVRYRDVRGRYRDWGEGTTVGYRRLLRRVAVKTDAIRLSFAAAAGRTPRLRRIRVY